MPYKTDPTNPQIVICVWPGQVSNLDTFEVVCEACTWRTGIIKVVTDGRRGGERRVYSEARVHARSHTPKLHLVRVEMASDSVVVGGKQCA